MYEADCHEKLSLLSPSLFQNPLITLDITAWNLSPLPTLSITLIEFGHYAEQFLEANFSKCHTYNISQSQGTLFQILF